MDASETIAAISSAVGAGARMIVRVSGEEAHRIARELINSHRYPEGVSTTEGSGGKYTDIDCRLDPSQAQDDISGGSALAARIWPGVTGWVYWFAGPRSYTGEDLVEFHVPGSPLLGRMLLDEIVRRGARLAEAGEFTARAYFNGRMDLTQAEGVAATIAAQSERELRAARQLLAGELARRLTPVMDGVAQALALVEVGIDFSDEDVTFLSAAEVRERCTAAIGVLEGILAESARFERLSHEPRIVLVGRPNAGKSTLLNALAGRQRAVVSNIAGTTRDAIWAEVRLARGMVRVVDVAGVEEVGSGQSAVGSEEEGIARQMHAQAMREVGEADLVILVREALCSFGSIELERKADLVIRTKVDLTDAAKRHPELAKDLAGSQMASNSAEILQSSKLPQDDGAWETQETVVVSAETGVGLDALRARLDALAFGADVGGGGLALNARHVRAIGEARDALGRAVDAVDHGAEVVAMELREALESLGSVLGRMSPDDLLGRIFSAFCIGK